MIHFRRRHRRQAPVLNTAALPDLIFTILFFFMLVTHMNKNMKRLKITVPQGQQLAQLAKKSAIAYIYVGPSATDKRPDAPIRIQLNDRLATVADIPDFVREARSGMAPEEASQLMVVIRADRNTPMQVITDIKQALRQAHVRRISYSADWQQKNNTVSTRQASVAD